jgi:hypothetical protein
MPLGDFIDFFFGELMGVGYFLGPKMGKFLKTPVTINLQKELPLGQAYPLVLELLEQYKVGVEYGNGIFRIIRKAPIAYPPLDFGRGDVADPDTPSGVVKIIPIQRGLRCTVSSVRPYRPNVTNNNLACINMHHCIIGHRPKTMKIHGEKWGEIVLILPESSGISEGYEQRKSLHPLYHGTNRGTQEGPSDSGRPANKYCDFPNQGREFADRKRRQGRCSVGGRFHLDA